MSEGALHNVQRIKKPNGVEHLYLRKTGLPRIKLQSPWPDAWEGSALAAEVGAIVGAQAPRPLPGTLRAATVEYEERDPDFHGLADSTKREYRRILDELSEDFGQLPISMFKPTYLLELRNTWALRGHRCANVNMQVLKNVLWPSVIAGQLGDGDPFALIPQARRPADTEEAHRLWPDEVVRLVIEAAIAERQYGLARAVALARFTGMRRGDLVKVARMARYGRPGSNSAARIAWRSGKRGVSVDIAEAPGLTHWLAVTPAEQPKSKWQRHRERQGVVTLPPATLVYSTRNRRFTANGLGQALDALVTRLHAAGRIDAADYNLHGLRHTRGVEIAAAGGTDAEGAAQMGHSSPSTFAIYRRQADRICLADAAEVKITKLRERAGNEAVNGGVNQL